MSAPTYILWHSLYNLAPRTVRALGVLLISVTAAGSCTWRAAGVQSTGFQNTYPGRWRLPGTYLIRHFPYQFGMSVATDTTEDENVLLVYQAALGLIFMEN